MAAMHSHPTPFPPSHTRPNLVRLLRSCERLSTTISSGAARHGDKRRFQTYLAVLQRQWHELASTSAMLPSSGVGDALLAEYRRKIERLAELLDADRMLSGSGSVLAMTQACCNVSLTRAEANAELSSRLQTTTYMQEAQRSQLLQPMGDADTGQDDADAAGGAAGAASAPGGPRLATRGAQASRATFDATFGRRSGGSRSGINDEALQTTLAEQREMHDTLLADLASSVGQLRDRSMQARQAVRNDNRTLDAVSEQMDGNRAKLDENNHRLRVALQAMRSSTCLICLLILVVCALFIGTFFLMKLVPKRPAAAVVPPPRVQQVGQVDSDK